MSTESLILDFIYKRPQGEIFTTRDVLHLGPRNKVDHSLSRAVKNNVIRRLARGVFLRNDPGVRNPSVEEVAQVKANSFGKQIYTGGKKAARKAGLIEKSKEEEEEEAEFATDGVSSSFLYGKIRVKLKAISARKRYFKDLALGLLIRALWWIGEEKMRSHHITVAFANLKLDENDYDNLCIWAAMMPSWMVSQFHWFG